MSDEPLAKDEGSEATQSTFWMVMKAILLLVVLPAIAIILVQMFTT